MIRVNLLPQKRETTRRASGEAGQGWVGLVLLVVVLELLGLFFYHRSKLDELAVVNKQAQGTQEAIDKIRRDTADHAQIKAQLTELRDREDAINKLQAARTGPTGVLLELSHILTAGMGPSADRDKIEQLKRDNPSAVPNPNWDPRRLWISKYTELDRSVKVEGFARDAEDVAEFLRRVSLSDYFFEVRPLPATESIDKDTHVSLKQFAIAAKVRY